MKFSDIDSCFNRPCGSKREKQSRRSTRGHRRRRNEKGSSHHLCQFHGSGLDLLLGWAIERTLLFCSCKRKKKTEKLRVLFVLSCSWHSLVYSDPPRSWDDVNCSGGELKQELQATLASKWDNGWQQ